MDLSNTKTPNSSKAKEELDLTHQQLKVVPPELSKFHHLHTLRLDDNHLEDVPWSLFMAMEHLTHLHLSRNRLSKLPDSLAAWDRIKVLDLRYNRITEFSPRLWPLLLDVAPGVELVGRNKAGISMTIDDPGLTRFLYDHFGKRLPKVIRMGPMGRQEKPFIDDVGSTEPLVYYHFRDIRFGATWLNGWQKGQQLRVAREYIKRDRCQRNRILLEENPVMETCAWLADDTQRYRQANDWQAELEWSEEEHSSDDDDDDDEHDNNRKAHRENKRKERREQRLRSKGVRDGRDEKMAP